MPRGVKKEVIYTGKAAKVHEKVLKLEADLKAAKEELKVAYKEQIVAEKLATAKAKKEAEEARRKAEKENTEKILKLIKESGKTFEEVAQFFGYEDKTKETEKSTEE